MCENLTNKKILCIMVIRNFIYWFTQMKLFKKRIVILGWILMTLVVAGISIAKAALPFTSISLWTSDLWNVLVEDAGKNTGLWLDIENSLSGNADLYSYSIIDDSPRFFIRWTGINKERMIVSIEYMWKKIEWLDCSSALYGYYHNPAFSEDELLPINTQTKEMLSSLALNKPNYINEGIDMTWWFYTNCKSAEGVIDSWAIFWVIKYTFDDKDVYLLAWVELREDELRLVNDLFLVEENVNNISSSVGNNESSWRENSNTFGLWLGESGAVVVGGYLISDPMLKKNSDIQVYWEFFDSESNSDFDSKSSIMLVNFEKSVPEDWIWTWEVKINWFNDAIWWWWLSDEVVQSSPEEEYTRVNNWYAIIQLEKWMNEKYICAFWKIEEEEQVICSDNKVKISDVRFEEDVPEDWTGAWEVKIKWEGEDMTKWWWLSEDNDVSVLPSEYTWVNASDVTIQLDEWMNGMYVCAFLQNWEEDLQVRCSENKVKIDNIDPKIELLSPTNSEIINLWDTYYFERSWLDDESGILWYQVTINGMLVGDLIEDLGRDFTIAGTDSDAWVWEWSVEAVDNAGNSAIAVWSFWVYNSNPWHGSAPVYLQFWNRAVPSMRTSSGRVDIEWSWSIWWWWLSDINDVWSLNIPANYTWVENWHTSIELTVWMNWKYICAFGVNGEDEQIICSRHKVKIDNENPELNLVTPINWTEFYIWDGINLQWNWLDRISGISWYTLTLNNLSWSTFTWELEKDVTFYRYTLPESWNWIWRVKACDYAGLCVERSWNFVSLYNWSEIYTWWFYLIRPSLWDRINLWNDITFSWNPWSINSWYVWEVSKVWWFSITWFTNSYSVELDGWRFTEWTYFWSVYDVASDNTKAVQVFYIVENWNNPDLKVNQFEFDDEKYAELGESYYSNTIEIDWLTDGWYTFAYLKDRKWVLWINGDFVWSKWYVRNGDKVYIELMSSSKRGETMSATLAIWTGLDAVYWSYKVTTDDDIGGWDNLKLSPLQKLWAAVFVDSLVEMYQHDEWKLATFLSTFMQVLEDKIDEYNSLAEEAEQDWDDDLVDEYKLYKNALVFLYTLVENRYNDIEVEERTVYVAPNGRQYLVEYDENRMAYTSPDFTIRKYFPTRETFTAHIDKNNSVGWGRWMVWNIITTHNGKVYLIYEQNWKWTSSDFSTAKYFDTKDDIVNHILANNPASSWNHKLDTNFIQVNYTAPNGKNYRIFKTSSEWSNPDMYSSYDFVDAKYFTSLDAAKKFINQSNPKK